MLDNHAPTDAFSIRQMHHLHPFFREDCTDDKIFHRTDNASGKSNASRRYRDSKADNIAETHQTLRILLMLTEDAFPRGQKGKKIYGV